MSGQAQWAAGLQEALHLTCSAAGQRHVLDVHVLRGIHMLNGWVGWTGRQAGRHAHTHARFRTCA